MRLLMVSGDRQTPVGEIGPFHVMQEEFSKHFERIDVLCPRPPKPQTVSVIHDNVFFHPASCGRLGMRGYIARRGAELIDELGHAVIVSHDYGWFYNGLGSAALSRATGVPYLSEIHHVPGFPVAADLREAFDRLIAKRYIRWARSRARAFRVVNHGEMPPLLKSWGVPEEKILVLGSLYIDLDLFSPPTEAVEPRWDVAFVGRLVNNKGLDRIVDALARLKAEGRVLSLLILGRGPERAAIEARVEKRGLRAQVEFVEWVETPSDLADVYRSSRTVVCASTCEGGPRVTVEAMACGTPPVSTRVGVMGELVEDGVNGALVGFDVESLAQGLWRVLGDEERRRELGRRAREATRPFEWKQAIARYAEGIKSLADGSEGRP